MDRGSGSTYSVTFAHFTHTVAFPLPGCCTPLRTLPSARFTVCGSVLVTVHTCRLRAHWLDYIAVTTAYRTHSLQRTHTHITRTYATAFFTVATLHTFTVATHLHTLRLRGCYRLLRFTARLLPAVPAFPVYARFTFHYRGSPRFTTYFAHSTCLPRVLSVLHHCLPLPVDLVTQHRCIPRLRTPITTFGYATYHLHSAVRSHALRCSSVIFCYRSYRLPRLRLRFLPALFTVICHGWFAHTYYYRPRTTFCLPRVTYTYYCTVAYVYVPCVCGSYWLLLPTVMPLLGYTIPCRTRLRHVLLPRGSHTRLVLPGLPFTLRLPTVTAVLLPRLRLFTGLPHLALLCVAFYAYLTHTFTGYLPAYTRFIRVHTFVCYCCRLDCRLRYGSAFAVLRFSYAFTTPVVDTRFAFWITVRVHLHGCTLRCGSVLPPQVTPPHHFVCTVTFAFNTPLPHVYVLVGYHTVTTTPHAFAFTTLLLPFLCGSRYVYPAVVTTVYRV